MRKMGYLKRDHQTLYRTSRTRIYYYENISMIPDERRYQVIDLTNQQSVGILGEEFMLTMAHVGLNFIVKGRVWQMKQITDDGKVYVLPVNDPTAAIPGWDGQILPVPGELAVRVGEYRKQIDKLLDEHKTRAPVVEGACHGVLHRHFPWELQMKQIAERFGALSRGRLMYGGAMKELQVRFRLTPIYDETIREAQVERADFEGVKKIFKQIRERNMEVRFFRSKEKPTPLAYHLLYRHVDIPELIAPENVAADNMARLRISIEGRAIDLLCFDCSNLTTEITIEGLPEHPSCQNCGSALLAPVFWSSAYVTGVLRKKRTKQSLDESEQKALTRARRSADLVIAYGRRAVIVQSVSGIGPQTVCRVLSKMHESDNEFYKDLLEAKLQFITTRPYWNN